MAVHLTVVKDGHVKEQMRKCVWNRVEGCGARLKGHQKLEKAALYRKRLC